MWAGVALIALAVAGCSQEASRFDYSGDTARAAEYRQGDPRYREESYSSWRRSERGDLRRPYRDDRRADTTGQIPSGEDEPHSRYHGDEDSHRTSLAPLHDRRPRSEYGPRRRTHTVRSGDTLYSIAREHDVDVGVIARANDLEDPSLIVLGDTLYIPRDGARYARDDDSRYRRERSAASDRATRRPPRRRAERTRRAERSLRGERTPRKQRTRQTERPRRAEPRRYSEDELYVDPLLREERRRARKPESEPRRKAERSSGERRRSAERRSSSSSEPRRSRTEDREPRRTAMSITPPPLPDQRPEPRRPVRTAKADEPDSAPVVHDKTAARLEDKPRKTADCSQLLKNPPERSGENFRRPANGLIVSRFGEKSDGQRNDGINISVPRGTPVKAAENGVVVYAGDELTGLGNLVLVRHADGWVSAYAHNDRILVNRCDIVNRGQEIARAGVSGSVTKPQIHFELRKNARPVDPEQYLAGIS